ncbi:hypothetical protein Ancab_040507 [Ancistrocladus abbreviatus]
MDFSLQLLWLLLAWLTIHFFLSQLRNSISNQRKLPPGPFSLPILGNLFDLGNKPHKSLARLASSHGPLMSLRLGQVTTIIISSAAVAKEVLQKNDLAFSTRNVVDVASALDHHQVSVIWLPVSPLWRNLRRVCNSQVFSSSRLDASGSLRRKKVEELLAYARRNSEAGTAVDIGKAAFFTSLNLLSNTFFSIDLVNPVSDTDCEFEVLLTGILEEASKLNCSDYFPVLKPLDLQGVRRRMGIHFRKTINLFSSLIDQRLQARESRSSEYNDVLDALLAICRDKTEELQQSHLPPLLVDLFVAGTETTSRTLEWAMSELLRNPDKLQKAKDELKNVIGKGNPIEEGDIASLPYLQSIIKETFRLHPTVPFLVPRKVDTDVELCGFVVPKNAQVLFNLWGMGRDPGLWENPNSFRPERFLASEIDVKGRDFQLIPFGAGRRICPGLPLALRMLHLMLGSLIHFFDWDLENGVKPENMDMDDLLVSISLRKAQPLRAIPLPVL